MTGNATEAAADLPPIEETEEVWNNEDEVATLPDHGEEIAAEVRAEEPDADPDAEPEASAEDASGERAERTPEQQKAQAFDELNAAFARDPIGYMRYMASLLTPEQRVAAGLQEQQAQDPGLPDLESEDWADRNLTEPEKFVKTNLAYIQDLPRFAQGVTRAMGTHEQALVQHDNSLAILAAQVGALLDAVGLDLPRPSLPQGIDRRAREAYAAQVKTAAEKVKAAQRSAATATPRTLRNGAAGGSDAGSVAAKGGESFTQLFRRVAAAARS